MSQNQSQAHADLHNAVEAVVNEHAATQGGNKGAIDPALVAKISQLIITLVPQILGLFTAHGPNPGPTPPPANSLQP